MKSSNLHPLISGANGLLGQYLCMTLSRREFTPVATGRRLPDSKIDTPFVVSDLGVPGVTDMELKDVEADSIIHCAAKIKGHDIMSFTRDNVSATINLAKLAKQKGIKKFIFISTVSVYDGEGPFTENSKKCLDDLYANSKLEAEKSLEPLSDADFRVISLRLAGLHGGTRKGGVVDNMINNARENIPIKISEPDSKLSFTFLEDVADAIQKLLTMNWPSVYATYNFACPDTLTLGQMATQILELTGSRVEPVTGTDLPRNRIMDVSKIESDFNISGDPIHQHIHKMVTRARRTESTGI